VCVFRDREAQEMETNISLSHLKVPEFFPECWKTMMSGELISFLVLKINI
jgi:hypothetical protein